jgi:Septum formation
MSRRQQRVRRSRLAVAVGLAGVPLVVSACGTATEVASADRTSGSTSTATRSQPQTPQSSPVKIEAPRPGECRTMRPKDIPPASNNTSAKPCSRRHTAVTYFVGKFRASVLDGSKETLSAVANSRCRHKFASYLHAGPATQSMSLLTYAYFYPTDKQRAAEANWFRCDAISGYVLQRRLYPLPHRLRGILAKAVPDSVRACYTRQFITGQEHRGAWVPCTKRHEQRTIAALRLGGPSARYAGSNELRVRVSAWCKPKARVYLHSPASYSWGYSWPSRSEWNHGRRHATCLAVTSR